MVFADRFEAGRLLADRLGSCKGALVLAIPRGGVEVGYAIAKQLKSNLGILISKKIPYPGQPELAVGAVCNDVVLLDSQLIALHGISRQYIDAEVKNLKSSIKRRYMELTGKAGLPDMKDRTVVIADDGIATGHTFLAAVSCVKSQNPKKIVAAIPVGPPESLQLVKDKVDKLIVLEHPAYFMAVGEFYRDFQQVEDEEVINLLRKANNQH
ncbi:phosphoribosyltransferase [Candidatus Woesearchaeota archaeon]|nr:phosphoribosyltransferase [Candidatus Woesearchaeota archaeon]